MNRDFRLPWGKQHELLSQAARWRKQAELLKLSRKARQKLEWFIYYYAKARESAATTIRYFGISKSVFYKWLAVFDPINLRALEESSRAPLRRRDIQVSRAEADRILSSTTTHVRAADASHGLVHSHVGTTLLQAFHAGPG